MAVGVRVRPLGVPHTESETIDLSGRSETNLPVYARYVGHLVLVALLALVMRNVTVRQPQAPAFVFPLTIVESQALAVEGAPLVGPETTEHYLGHNAVPLTVRLRGQESNPIAEPRRQMRTDVITYKVQAGDSVLAIAERFNLEGSSLLWANKALEDNPDWLQIGDELSILPVDGALHTVAKGDTIASVAKFYKVEPEVITGYAGNAFAASNALEAGQKLIIPGGTKPYVARQVLTYSGSAPKDAKKGSGAFAWPMSGFVSQPFRSWHGAIDIAASKGTTIVAADAGYVVAAQWTDVGYGRMVIIDHGNGYRTLYAHMSTYSVAVGDSVARGQAIGECGSTGNSTGPHLHFEIIQGDGRLNPYNYLP